MPVGTTPPVKSAALTAGPVTAHWALAAPLRSPVRVTVKVNGELPDWPSALSALVAAIDSEASSLRTVPLAEAVPRMAPAPGLDSITEKASFASTAVSPATPMLMTFELSPAAKLTVPVGTTPPVKSAALTAGPVTAHWALAAPRRSPVRVTVKVNSELPDWPSGLSALVAAIDSEAGMKSSLTIAPVALPSRIDAPSDGSDRVTVKVSSASTIVSPATATRMFCCITPGAKVRVPLWAT